MTIFSNDSKICKDLAIKAEVGIVSINKVLRRDSDFPSGGIKDTGFGIDNYHDGLLEISNRKSLINKWW